MKPRRYGLISLRNEKGFVLTMTGVSMVALVSFFALVVDLGRIYVTKSELQNAADAAALAAIVEVSVSQDTARESAFDFGTSHYAAGSNILFEVSDVQFGHFDFETSQFSLGEEPTNGLEVKARRVTGSPSGPLPLFFAPFFGKDSSNVQASSKAVLDRHVVGVTGKNRLIPYSVIDFVVDANLDEQYDIGSEIDIYPRDDAPGNFGFLDLDGGSNDIPELREYIEGGYDQDFIIPADGSVPVWGSPGINGNSLLPSFSKIEEEIVFLPVHDRVEFQGDIALFNVVGVLAVRIKSVKLTGALQNRYIRVEIISFASSVLATDPRAPENNSVAKPRLIG